MALDESDILDRAMDAAEAQMLDAQDTEAPEPKVESAPEEAATEQEPAQEEEKPVAKSSSRDEKGKFTKAQREETEQISETEQDVAAEPQAQAESVTPPMFWSPEHKSIFAKAPVEAQKAILHYENQRNVYVNRLENEVNRAKEFDKRLYSDMQSPDEIRQHKDQLRLSGIRDEVEELHRYRTWDRIFKHDIKTGIADLMAKNNLTPYDYIDDGNNQTQNYQGDPRVEQALQAAEEAKQLAQQYQEQIEQQRTQSSLAQVEAFKQGKDSSGQSRAQYFDFYKPQIINAMQEILQARPDIAELEALNHAYEFVIGETRKVFGVNASKPSAQPVDSRKAKMAASSVTGAPSRAMTNTRPKLSGKTDRDKIDEAMDLAEEAMSSR